MPYISPEQQYSLCSKLEFPPIRTPGALNFIIVRLICWYLILKEEVTYSDYNEIVGVLECVKQELFRRRINPYEERKLKQNGDVFINGGEE